MAFEPGPIGWFNLASGLALALLGTGILLVKPRRRISTVLALYLVSFGLAFMGEYTAKAVTGREFSTLEQLIRNPLLLVAAIMAARLSFLVGGRVGWSRRATRAAIAGGTATALAAAFIYTMPPSVEGILFEDATAADILMLVWSPSWGILWFAIWHLFERVGDASASQRGELAVAAAALSIWPASIAAASHSLVLALAPQLTSDALLGLAIATWTWPLVASLAILGTALVIRPQWQTRQLLLLMALWTSVAGISSLYIADADWIYGTGRFLAALALSYAILRHQFLGLGVRVKWTIKQSTVAAAFVAVFFVISEAAATVLGDTTGSQYWGIAGAGLLVFAIAPLQRLAERLSDKALPGVKPIMDMDDAERAFAYGEAVKAAWADGVLSRDERALLDRLGQSLKLDDARAARIERSVTSS